MTNALKFIALLLAISANCASHAQQSEVDEESSPPGQPVAAAEDVAAEDGSPPDQLFPVADDDLTDEGSPLDQVVPVADDDPADEGSPLDQVVPVAEDEGAARADDPLTLNQRLADEFERYQRLITEGAMDEADSSAKRIVELAIKIHGPRSLETSKALNNLAIVQSRNGQYDAAIQNFESAVDIIEEVEDRLNVQLVNPLKGLGAAQLANGRPDLASRTFDRATHITHVNEGPHNIEQVEILEGLAQTSLLLGDAKGARAILDRIHALNVRHFAGDAMALLPSLMRRANWQHTARYYNDERATYRRIVRIIEENLGKDDPRLILPLQKLGKSFYFVDITQSETEQRGMITSGEIYFKRAATIAEEAPDTDWRELAEAKLALADHYIYIQSQNRARRLYSEIWTFLSADDERLELRAEALEKPVVLFEDPIPRYAFKGADADPASDSLLTGKIRVDYTVSTRGRVRNLRTEAFPPQFTDMQRMVHREIRRRVFRPQMADGELRQSDNLVFEHAFFYRQSDLDKLIGEQEEET